MSNKHPEPHPENLIPLKKGDPNAKEVQSKGGKARAAKYARQRTMKEWADFFGNLPMKSGKTKDPKSGDKIKDSNMTMDGAVLASAYSKALKGDVRAIQFLATLKGQFAEEITVHTDPLDALSEDQLDAIIDAISKAKKSDD